MNEDENPKEATVGNVRQDPKSLSLSSMLIWGAVGLMVYVLGLGPVALLHFKCKNPAVRTVIEIVYKPMEILADTSPLRKPIEWYVNMWIGSIPYK